jgi:hypothetical protein
MVEHQNPTKPCGVSTNMPTSPLTKKHLRCALPLHQEQHWPNQWSAMLGGHEVWPQLHAKIQGALYTPL